MINLFTPTNLKDKSPEEILSCVTKTLSPEDRQNFSTVNKRIQELFFIITTSITIGTQYTYMDMTRMLVAGDLKPSLYVDIVSRYPNLKEIVFGKTHSDNLQIQINKDPSKLIQYFESKKGKKQLSGIERITFRTSLMDEIDKLYQCLFHKNLIYIKLSAFHVISPEFFTKFVHLQTLKLNYVGLNYVGLGKNEPLPLLLTHLTSLTKIKITTNQIFPSICLNNSCKEFIVKFAGNIKISRSTVQPFFNLKRLEILSYIFDCNYVFKECIQNLSSLESITINLTNISNKGIKVLTQNCPNINILKCFKDRFEDRELDSLVNGFTNLQVLHLESRHTTDEVLETVKKNNKLKFINLTGIYSFDLSKINDLESKFLNLTGMKLTTKMVETKEGLARTKILHLEQLSKITTLKFLSLEDYEYSDWNQFQQNHPHIKPVPFDLDFKYLSLKKLDILDTL